MALPPESHRLQPDHLPTPFSAEQIRDYNRPGRTMHLRTEVPGEKPSYRVIRFVEVDADGAVQEHWAADEIGEPIGELVRRRTTWIGFQYHASQPRDLTTVDELELELPFGRFDCWRYTVRGENEDSTIFWFAKELPGMPVQIEDRDADELIEQTTMIANTPGT